MDNKREGRGVREALELDEKLPLKSTHWSRSSWSLVQDEDLLLEERSSLCCLNNSQHRFSFPIISDMLTEHVRSRFLAIGYPLVTFFFITFWLYQTFTGLAPSDDSSGGSSQGLKKDLSKLLQSSTLGIVFFIPGLIYNSVHQSHWLVFPVLISNTFFLVAFVLLALYLSDDLLHSLGEDPFLAVLFAVILLALTVIFLRTLWAVLELFMRRRAKLEGRPIPWLFRTFREERWDSAVEHVKKLLTNLYTEENYLAYREEYPSELNSSESRAGASNEMHVKPSKLILRAIYQDQCQSVRDIFLPTRFILGLAFSVWTVLVCLFVFNKVANLFGDLFEELFKDEDDLKTLFRVVHILVLTSGYLTGAVILLNLIMMVLKYRNTMFNVRLGITCDLDPKEFGVTSAQNYVGYQTIHTLAAFWATAFILSILSSLLFTVMYIPALREKFLQIVWDLITRVLLTAIVAFIISYILANCVFSSYGRQYINNRRLFALYDFLLLFSQLSVGVMSTIKNMAVIEVFILLSFMRLDQAKAPRRIESWDSGYSAWASMVKLDNYYTNPVGMVFLRKIREVGSIRWTSDRKWIRNKWWLLCLLMKNPELVKYRKHNLDKQTNMKKNLLVRIASAPGLITRK